MLVETNARPGEQPRTFEVGALVAEGGQGIVHEVTEMKDGVPQPGPPLGTGLVVKLLRRLPGETRDPQGPWEALVLRHLQLGLGCPYIVPAPIVATWKQPGRRGDLGLVFPRLRGKSNWLEFFGEGVGARLGGRAWPQGKDLGEGGEKLGDGDGAL